LSTVASDHVRTVLRCIPDASSGEVVSTHDICVRLNLSRDIVARVLLGALRAGLVERPRFGVYRLAPKPSQSPSNP
jgi:hypothetical protein